MENSSRRILILPPEEARRIAAGEVIDRPAALVREFLDNAIDAGASSIEVNIEEGGCKKIEVTDDGCGMTLEDLKLCTFTHATSKIRCLDDLETSVTLGFRGEALSAAAAVSRLEISCSADGREAYLLEAGPGGSFPLKIEQTRRTRGATVRALNIFHNVPARKRFLKREGSEASLCRQAFIDKAIAFPQINFRFIQDGKQREFFPAVSEKKERFSAALLKQNENFLLHEIKVSGDGFNAAVVTGSPDLYRNDRRHIYIFANGRRVQEYSLIQAVEYGAQGWFPNGTHPVAAVFVDINPSLADFNIHPAKREVRFRDPGAIHQAVSGGLKNFFHNYFLSSSQKNSGKDTGIHQTYDFLAQKRNYEFKDIEYENPDQKIINLSSTSYNNNTRNSNNNIPNNDNFLESLRLNVKSSDKFFLNDNFSIYNEARFVGRLFNLFILIEWGDRLFIIDQHAAHERILYNHFLENPAVKQELLAPIPFRTESDDEDRFLTEKKEELSRLGIGIEKDEDAWRIDALPAGWRLDDGQTVSEILKLRTAGENLTEKWAASLCCKAAIKDGDIPDDKTAFALGKEALLLADPHCPHGRPIWTEISREALFKAVRRS